MVSVVVEKKRIPYYMEYDQNVAGCTFEEDSDPTLCEYRQAQEDDFDWTLVRTYSWPHMTSDLTREPPTTLFCKAYRAFSKHRCVVFEDQVIIVGGRKEERTPNDSQI
ncbi:hypothetical protein DNTS_005353 [Danionella cerebrum]|uniref:MAM domain-containing protein n=1 Tax=Danionella cerebrum TaxID=2873325 RepID=A0A553MQX2_9TELE|nr:hypothetical protein DNTS_005353 [Danionella translucida]